MHPVERDFDIPVDMKRLYGDVRILTSIEPPRNYRNVSSLNRVADYIFKEFSKCCSRVEVQEYEVRDSTYKNVIASFGPQKTSNKNERIVVGAHYDVCGDQPGADDNASGVAAVLEIARLFSTLRPHLKRRIDLVAYSLEEPPFFRSQYMGSAIHAKSLAQAGIKLHIMISVDMIGHFSKSGGPSPYFSSLIEPGTVVPGRTTAILGKKGDEKIAKRIKRYMMETSGELVVAALNFPEGTRGLDHSDHLNYWNHGYRAVMISNFPVSSSSNYHQVTDTTATLDFGKLTEVVRGLYRVLVNL